MTMKDLARTLGLDTGGINAVAPLLSDAAAALAEVRVPTEAEIHDIVAGAYRFTQNQSLESEDTDRRLEEAMKNVSKWRQTAEVYLNGAAVLLRRASPNVSRYEAKKRVLAAFRTEHSGMAVEKFYFTREKAIELPPDVRPLPPRVADPFNTKPQDLNDDQLDHLVRLLATPADPKSPDAKRIVDLLVKCGERAGPSVLRAINRPDETAQVAEGERAELLIGIRTLLPRMPEPWPDRVLRAALEAGWLEWLDRPLLDPPLNTALREKLLKEFGTRQDPGGNPYRPTEPWFYNLDPT